MSIVTRFAPSPTGYLHIGSARTALFNYLYTRHVGGKFLMRIEDTDAQRSTQEATDAIFRSLEWLGIKWDGDTIIQSSRRNRHVEIAHELVRLGKAYLCYMTSDEIAEMKAGDQHKKVISPWRDPRGLTPPSGIKPTIRIYTPDQNCISSRDHDQILSSNIAESDSPKYDGIGFNDLIRGNIFAPYKDLDDMVLLRSDGTPTYMLAVVVDDHDSGVTHVIRGSDHLSNTHRQLQIYHALNWSEPVYAHIPLINGSDGAKMSKRHGAVGIEWYKDEGYLPEAMVNYLLRLGWGGDGSTEIYSVDEAIAAFDIRDVCKASACFDFAKLNSINAHYLRKMDVKGICDIIEENDKHQNVCSEIGITREKAELLIPLILTKCDNIKDLIEQLRIFIHHPIYDKIAQGKFSDNLHTISFIADEFAKINWNTEEIKSTINDLHKKISGDRTFTKGDIMHLLRFIAVGNLTGPSLIDLILHIGRDAMIARTNNSLISGKRYCAETMISMPIGIIGYIEKALKDRLDDILTQHGSSRHISVVGHRTKLCTYQADFIFALAKKIGMSAENVYHEMIAHRLSDLKGISFNYSAGFLEIIINNEFLREISLNDESPFGHREIRKEGIIIDYSSPNVAKELHIGHLRSTIIGDCASRIGAFIGHDIYPQNHLGDCGMQFGFLLQYLIDNKSDFPELFQNWVDISTNKSEDCGDDIIYSSSCNILQLISRINEAYRNAKKKFDEDGDFAMRSNICLEKLQRWMMTSLKSHKNLDDLDNDIEAMIWMRLYKITRVYLKYIYNLLNIKLEDDDIRGESFYLEYTADALSDMKERSLLTESNGALVYFSQRYRNKDGEPFAEIIQKRDGNMLYSTTDIAALWWRAKDFRYHDDAQTTINKIIYVTDNRQSFHFQMLFEIGERCGWLRGESITDTHGSNDLRPNASAVHIPFGTILDSNHKPFKTRSGESISLLSFINDAIDIALQRIRQSHHLQSTSEKELREYAKAIAIGGIKYQDLKNDIKKDYVFDQESIGEFEGNTASYIQNAFMRICSIKAKFVEREGGKKIVELDDIERGERWKGVDSWGKYIQCIFARYYDDINSSANEYDLSIICDEICADDLALLLKLWEFCDVVHTAFSTLRLHLLCSYLFDLANTFHRFYEKCDILNAEKDCIKIFRMRMALMTQAIIYVGLYMLGIDNVERM